MPVKKNPSSIKSGSGVKPTEATNWSLTTPPTGKVDEAAADYDEAKNDHPLDGVSSPLNTHLDPDVIAHTASNISIDGKPKETFTSQHVEGALDELSALIPPKPPKIGTRKGYMTVSGIPDWGVLKLNESFLYDRFSTYLNAQGTNHHATNDPSKIYPYYWYPPNPAWKNPVFEPDGTDSFDGHYITETWNEGGKDPQTDPTFNVIDTTGSGYNGGGAGNVYSGGFTRDTAFYYSGLHSKGVVQTLRIYPIGQSSHFNVVVSGVVYPADRGVLALLHWPNGVDKNGFLAKALNQRVVAATLLGKGILGDKCPCDGDPGGIFLMGSDSNGDYDPYEWPGQASGQGSLYELHRGISENTEFFTSNDPYFNFDGLSYGPIGVSSSLASNPCEITTSIPHGFSDGDIVKITGHTNNAVNSTFIITVISTTEFSLAKSDGIPLATTVVGAGGIVKREIGCNKADYVIFDADKPYPGQVRLGSDPNAGVPVVPEGIPILGGGQYARGGGDDNNFLRYRLPYLDDYEFASPKHLKWTPEDERWRYFKKPTVASSAGIDLLQAGDYSPFVKDYWPFQMARYRHRFEVHDPACADPATADGFDLGSYVLIHFKKEAYFEELVRDGIIPTQDKIYSINLEMWGANSPYTPEHLGNSIKSASPHIETSAASYHVVRSSIFGENLVGSDLIPNFSGQFEYNRTEQSSVPVSGIYYFCPSSQYQISSPPKSYPNTYPNTFALKNVAFQITGLFDNSYRVSERAYNKISPSPVTLGLAPFSYEHDPPTFTSSLGTERRQRVDLGMESLGYDPAVTAPTPSDPVSVFINDINLFAENKTPTFSTNARMRTFAKKPIGHSDVDFTLLPKQGFPLNPVDGKRILYTSIGGNTMFGNLQMEPLTDTRAIPSVEILDRLYNERFLDEVYRCESTFANIVAADPAFGKLLAGPGLTLTGTPKPILIPVSLGRAVSISSPYLWKEISWLQNDAHKQDLSLYPNELQVSGLPDRNPPIEEGVIVPFPSTGLLQYPQENYSLNHRPSDVDSDLQYPQRDYSGLTGTRRYTRVFDVGRNGVDQVAGQPIFSIRIDGIKLEDFNYYPHPNGAFGSEAMAIFVKVPGLTTWMDIGRRDGDGPSKQDLNLDGAGCQVVCPETKDGIDPQTGMVYCEVKINVGTTANLFANHLDNYRIPILFQVRMYDFAKTKEYNLRVDNPHPSNASGVSSSDLRSGDIKGIIGVKVLPFSS